jgi:fructose-1,6-bisphosphatase/inositol monophosphatase family enzyme
MSMVGSDDESASQQGDSSEVQELDKDAESIIYTEERGFPPSKTKGTDR